MKRGLIGLFLLIICSGSLFAQGRYENQEYISRPKSENWFVYIDYSLSIVNDFEIKSQSTEDLVGTTATPFLASDSTDIEYKENILLLGISWILLDKEDEGKYSLYGSVGTTNATLGLFPSGKMGISGYYTKWGIEGDLWKFGRFLDKGISFDAALIAYMSSGDGTSGTVDQDYDLFGYGVDIRGYFNAKANLADATETLIYLGGQLRYTFNDFTLENTAPTWSGTGIYDLQNKLANFAYFILGAKVYWEKDRTTVDIQLASSLDRSYVIGIKLAQTF